jgi:hypothetical protein
VRSYAEFWNEVFYGADRAAVGPDSLEAYWTRLVILVAVCLVLGLASSRWRVVASVATVTLIAVYVASVVPYLLWAASCPGCGASFSYDTARSFEAMIHNVYWGGLLGMGMAALWLGVWLSGLRPFLR